MFFSSQQMLFFCLLISGTFTAISSTSWFLAWIGLELNLMSFIPLISNKTNRYSSEAALKYFLIQALASAILVGAAPFHFWLPSIMPLLLAALLVKLGAAPFHFWLPSIMEGLNWSQAFMLMTLQKVAPMFLITHLLSDNLSTQIILISSMLSAVTGAIGGLNQTSLRKVLAFSSISHISWMLAAIYLSETTWIMYFSFYSLISFSVVVLFNHQQAYYLPQLAVQSNHSAAPSLISALSLLSLGGLPPFTGFFPKWVLIESLANAGLIWLLIILIGSALVTLYYYLRVSITSIILLTTKKKTCSTPYYSSSLAPIFISMNFFLLLMPSSFALI
uniref:NADH dehydrogenase subunit 2 n=1 Tax=Jasus edwardsii TaxID=95461 RepID=UPI00315D4B84